MILGLRQRKHKMRFEHLGVPESKKLLDQKKKKKKANVKRTEVPNDES